MSGLLQPLAALRTLSAARCSRAAVAPSRSAVSAFRSLTTSSRSFQRPAGRPTLQSLTTKAAPPSAGSFFAQSYLPYNGRGSFFTPSSYLSTSAVGLGPAPAGTGPVPESAPAVEDVRIIPRSLPGWLIGCSALVFGIIVIGGLTRLTESGLSIVEWNPITGIRPPMTEAEWDIEWEKYRQSPEGVMINSNISRAEFKFIFYMEWAHRIAGRALGALFVVPAVYYCSRYKLPRGLPTTLFALAAGIGAQGALGWFMVASGLKPEIIDNKDHPRVSQYRLAAHFGAAVLLYIGMLYTGLSLRRDQRLAAQIRQGGEAATRVHALVSALNAPAVRRFRGLIGVLAGMVFVTAISGAFVAGLDAGLVYNEFPMMGESIHPPKEELMDPRYCKTADKSDLVWRNMFENPVTVQFNHRVLAVTTASLLIVQHLIARRPVLRVGTNALPRVTQRWSAWTAAAALGQVTLGISTLIYLVPIPLAAAHQAGSVVVLTCLMGLAASMRRPGRAVEAMRRAVQQVKQKKI